MIEDEIKDAVSDKLRKFREFYLDKVKLPVTKVSEISFDSADCFFLLEKDKTSTLKPYKGGMFTAKLKICIEKPERINLCITETFYLAISVHFNITYGEDSFDISLPDRISIVIY